MVCSHCLTPETDTKTESDLDTDKFTMNPMGICVGLYGLYEHLHTILYNPFFIGFFIGPGVGQCEHTTSGFSFAKSLRKRHVQNYWQTDQEHILDRFLKIWSGSNSWGNFKLIELQIIRRITIRIAYQTLTLLTLMYPLVTMTIHDV